VKATGQGAGEAVFRATGYSYAEVLLAVALVAILIVPAMQSLGSARLAGSGIDAARQQALRAKLESVLSKPFGVLYAETYQSGGNTTTSVSGTLSDAVGTENRRLVVLYRFDATTKALSSADTGLVDVSVYYEAEGAANALRTLAGRWW